MGFLLLAISGAYRRAGADTPLLSAKEVPAGPSPDIALVADVNGDGVPDIIVGQTSGTAIMILPGLGGGAFGAPDSVHLGGTTKLEDVADFNGDGHPDLLVLGPQTAGAQQVEVLLGHGDFTFSTATTFGFDGRNRIIQSGAADVTGDGKIDVVTLYYSDPLFGPPNTELVVEPGNGDGSFGFPTTITRPESNVTQFVLGDIDGDGRADVALLSLDTNPNRSTVTVALGQPQGAPTGSIVTRLNFGATSIQLADVNGDGRPDLLAAGQNGGPSFAYALLGDGSGAFEGLVDFVLGGQPYWFGTAVGKNPVSIAAGDLNGDGIADLVSANAQSQTVTFDPGKVPGVFAPLDQYTIGPQFSIPGQPANIVLADLDGDGVLDAVVGHAGTGTITVLRNTRCGSIDIEFWRAAFAPPNAHLVWRSATPMSYSAMIVRQDEQGPQMTLGDATVDGSGTATFDDSGLVAGHLYHYWLTAAVGSCQVTTTDFQTRAPSVPRLDFNDPGYPMGIAAGDLDRDGGIDFVTADYFGRSVSLLSAGLDGSLRPAHESWIRQKPTSIVSADFNGDGIPDFLTGNPIPNTPDSSSLSMLLGRPDGTLSAPTTWIVGGQPTQVYAADFNGDGRMDLATTGIGSVLIWLGNGDGTFQRARAAPTSMQPWVLAIGDFDEDGVPDLAVAVGFEFGALEIHLGKGDGTFGPAVTSMQLPWIYYGLFAADLDGDHHLDIGLTEYQGPYGQGQTHLWLFAGDGIGHVRPPVKTNIPPWTHDCVAADLDGDGRLDLACPCDGDTSGVLVLANQGGYSFTPQRLLVAAAAQQVLVGDWTHDGAPDLAVAGGYRNVVSIFPGSSGLVPNLASLIDFDARPGSVSLRWWVPSGRGLGVHAWRRSGIGDLWKDLGAITFESPDVGTFVDHTVAAGRSYVYRLRTGSAGWLGEDAVIAIPGATHLRFAGAQPSPAPSGAVVLMLELETSQPARLDLFDLQGRRIRSIDVPAPTPGLRSFKLTASSTLPPGVYGARMSQGTRVSFGRFVVVP